jgi:hypothetical protein
VLVCGWGEVFDITVVAGRRTETAVELVELALVGWRARGLAKGENEEINVPRR